MDTSYLVETPEGIDLQAQLAGPVPRALAYGIDLSLRTAGLALFSLALVFVGQAGLGLIMLVAFLLEWFYPVFFEMYAEGQTPGKKRLGIAAVSEDLSPLTFSSSILRNLLRVADFLPIGYVTGIVCMVSNAHFQRLGDIAAGTVVLHRPSPRATPELPAATPCSPPLPLTLDEQLAVLGLAYRSRQLSLARQRELADILGPELHAEGDAALDRLRGMARWLLGER